eukprot:3631755-Prorocentrum_lima.AAC.1
MVGKLVLHSCSTPAAVTWLWGRLSRMRATCRLTSNIRWKQLRWQTRYVRSIVSLSSATTNTD